MAYTINDTNLLKEKPGIESVNLADIPVFLGSDLLHNTQQWFEKSYSEQLEEELIRYNGVGSIYPFIEP